jgi:DNA-binding NarL/FixJ family response regulator
MAETPQIIVVDDEPLVLKQTVLALADDFTVRGASSLEEGLRLFDEAGKDVSVLITDMRLHGERHGGLQLARRLRERKLETEILFLTGYPQIEDASLCMEVGAFGYVEKGRAETYDRLRELAGKALARWLERHDPPPASRPRLLILDDYPAILKELTHFLGRKFQVSGAQTLDEAFDLLQGAAAEELFSVAITDMQLQGDRKGGLRLAEELSRRPDRPEIIFLTGHPQIEDASRCMELGAFGYVEKGRADSYQRLEELCLRAVQKWQQRTGRAAPANASRKSAGPPCAARPTEPPPEAPAEPPLAEIFVSYSHEDTRYREVFESHMAALRKYGKITIWSDAAIKPSSLWREEIEAAISRARMGVALVSKNYIQSDFCTNVELQEFLRARSERGLKLIAIVVADCYWQGIPDISRFQILPQDRHNMVKPIKSFKDKDAAWASVVKAIADLLAEQPPPG